IVALWKTSAEFIVADTSNALSRSNVARSVGDIGTASSSRVSGITDLLCTKNAESFRLAATRTASSQAPKRVDAGPATDAALRAASRDVSEAGVDPLSNCARSC